MTPNDPKEWVAVPVEAAPIPREWVSAARVGVANTLKTSFTGGEKKELSGGIARCSECGGAMTVRTAKFRNVRTFYYVCGSSRRYRGREFQANRYHRADELERRVREFV